MFLSCTFTTFASKYKAMSNFQLFKKYIKHFKYIIVIIVGIVLVGFVGENSFLSRRALSNEIKELNDQIDSMKASYAADSIRLSELDRNPAAIEKIAREKYFMKTDDEDIFMFADDKK